MINKLVPLIPKSQVYCESYGGAASILFNLEPRPVEVYNDIDDRLVNLLRVLQDVQSFDRFCQRLYFTSYSLEEFRKALAILDDPSADREDAAWAFFVAQTQGFGGWVPKYEGNWGRSFVSSRGMATTVSSWLSRLENLQAWHERISRVQIDSREALEVIRYWDGPATVHYVDPPYVLETRRFEDEGGHSYRYEPDEDYHRRLVETLLDCEGAVVMSCYDHPVYAPLEQSGWSKSQWKTSSSAAGRKRGSKLRGSGAATLNAPRVETVYRNPKAVEMVEG